MQSGEEQIYSWDHRNRLTQVEAFEAEKPGEVAWRVEYEYDQFDRRSKRTFDPDADGQEPAEVEHYVYDGDHIALIINGDGNVTNRLLYGPQVDELLLDDTGSAIQWAMSDHLGTVRALVNNHDFLERMQYGAFGQLLGVEDLQSIRDFLSHNSVGDFQILVTHSGRVLMIDPSRLERGRASGDLVFNFIDHLLD